MNKKLSDIQLDEFIQTVQSMIENVPKDHFVGEVRKVVTEMIGESHIDQHKFIQMLIDEREEKKRRRKALEDKIAGSLILSVILGAITLIGSGAMDWLRGHIK